MYTTSEVPEPTKNINPPSQPLRFDPSNPGYTFQNAYALAWASHLAYKDEVPDADWPLENKNKIEVQPFGLKPEIESWRSTQVYVVIDPDSKNGILAFRGSEKVPVDWLTNLDFPTLGASGGAVHEGFWNALNEVWSGLNGYLEERIKAKKLERLWITGHSLGGALAVLTAARLVLGEAYSGEGPGHDAGAIIEGIYTFGQPRLGDWQFASNYPEQLGNKTFRFVNNNDIVPRVPPADLGFRHVGQMLLFDQTGALTERDNPGNFVGDYYKNAEKIVKDSKGQPGFTPISDHSLANYLRKLAANKTFRPEALPRAPWRKVWFEEFVSLKLLPGTGGSPASTAPAKIAPAKITRPPIGLALSGGGIRSATFNLGLLQSLAGIGLLSKLDYLSTVSGGGYIGGWLTAWIHRVTPEEAKDGESATGIVESRLGGAGRQKHAAFNDAGEPRTVTWLRRFSNYLTPRTGPFSPDTLAGAATWLRNTLLNQLILAAGLLVLLNCVWGLYFSLVYLERSAGLKCSWAALPLIAWALLLVAGPVRWAIRETWAANGGGGGSSGRSRNAALGFAFAWLSLPFAISTLNVGFPKPPSEHALMNYFVFAPPASAMAAFALGAVLIALTSTKFPRGIFPGFLPISENSREWWARANGMLLHVSVLWVAVALLALGVPYLWLRTHDLILGLGGGSWLATVLAGVWSATNSGTDKASAHPSRIAKALARVAPYVFIVGLLGLLSTGLHYGAWAIDQWLHDRHYSPHDWSQTFCPQSPNIPGWDPAYRVTTSDSGLAVDSAKAVNHCKYEDYARDSHRSLPLLGKIAVAALVIWLLLGFLVDINVFSFHYFYRNRLERCYLGASNSRRRPNDYTGLANLDTPKDDMPNDSPRLEELATTEPQSTGQKAAPEHRPSIFGLMRGQPVEKVEQRQVKSVIRPYPLINTTLNISHDPVAGATDRLGWQERKAASFLMSPLYCGYRLAFGERGIDAFQRTKDFGSRFGGAKTPLTLGMAMTISGAAASPNWGYHTNPASAFLMTVFNARLGWWIRNPRQFDGWHKGNAPSMGAWLLLNELLGTTSDRTDYVYLSDGGHFENLGIYELVRRRCAVIIASDAGQDEKYTFEDLGNAIRKCRTDFGVNIDINPRPIMPDDKGLSAQHCAVGIIRYPETEELPAERGWLLYIKASLTGDESADVLQYRRQNDEFPHQSTADQWFDEAQFESYRKLGQHVGEEVLLSRDLRTAIRDLNDTEAAKFLYTYMGRLRWRWRRRGTFGRGR